MQPVLQGPLLPFLPVCHCQHVQSLSQPLFGFSCPALASSVRLQTTLILVYHRPEVICNVLSSSVRCDFLPLTTKTSPKVEVSNMHHIILCNISNAKVREIKLYGKYYFKIYVLL